MNWRTATHCFTHRGQSRSLRAWPLLVLLVLILVAGIGCVIWFMREAMANERMAVRQRLADAYGAHLQLVQGRLDDLLTKQVALLDTIAPGTTDFEAQVPWQNLDSVICFGPDGRVLYPQLSGNPTNNDTDDSSRSRALANAEAVQTSSRNLIRSGSLEAATKLIEERFDDADLGLIVDPQGRLIAANAELMVLEAAEGAAFPQLLKIKERLLRRLIQTPSPIWPSQRRFLIRQLQRLKIAEPSGFPRFHSEDIAARYLESGSTTPKPLAVQTTALPGFWQILSPQKRTLAIFTAERLRGLLHDAIDSQLLPQGVTVNLVSPSEETQLSPTPLITQQAGQRFPGWKLVLSLDDHAAFEAAASQKVTRYLWIAVIVTALMTALGIVTARTFGRQVQLARLKNDLVATVSHELKTPLTSMRALVDTLLDTEKLDEQTTREYLQLLAQENTRLSRLIDNVLTFSRLERNRMRFNFTSVSPDEIIADAVAAMGERCHAPDCQLELRVSSDLPLIPADRDALTTALLNLLDNAWKYSGNKKHIILSSSKRNGSLLFTVQDNGIGLPPHEIRRVFRRFYQVDHRLARETGGCGLGLSIVEQIVSAHRGKVHVTSELNRGSTFTIEIPLPDKGASA